MFYELINYFKQYCGSGASWIRIRFAVLDPNPDPKEHGNRPKLTNKPDFQPFKKAFVPAKVCFMT